MRDITLETTFYQMFTTRAFATGIPTTLAGTPVISAYEDNNVTQITAGVSLTVDFDGVTGLNLITVVATAANGFENGKSYALVVTTGTVATVSVVGEVVGEFTIGQSAAAVDLANGTDGLGAIKGVVDTIEGETDDIGVAGVGLSAIPWNAVWDAEVESEVTDALDVAVPGSPTAGSINERVKTMDDADIPGRLPAALVGGRIDASIGAVAAGVIAAASFAANALDAVWSTTIRLLTAGTNIVLAKGTGVTGFNDLSTAQVNAEVDTGISDARLDELVAATAGGTAPVDGSIMDEVMNKDASQTFDPTTDSLEAIRDNQSEAAAAVWDEALSDHETTGTAGKKLGDIPLRRIEI